MMIDILTKTGKVAVWGIGYLGYTTLIRLQRWGFSTRVWTPEKHCVDNLRSDVYPGKELQFAWSEAGVVPPLNLEHCTFAETPEEMFAEDTLVHVIALPNRPRQAIHEEKVWNRIAQYLRKTGLEQELLIILSAAAVHGDTDEFVRVMGSSAGSLHIATAFRSDWTLEHYLYRDGVQAVGGDEKSAHFAQEFLKRLGIKSFAIGSTRDAEVYHAYTASMHNVLSAYSNQFSLAYPRIDMQHISDMAMKTCRLVQTRPSIGIGGRQMLNSVEFSLMGSEYNSLLTILKESQTFNLSSVVMYCDYLVRKKVKKVGILGITPQPDDIDLTFSPSVLLAESLIKRGVEVFVHDPLFSFEKIVEVIPRAKPLDIGRKSARMGIGKKDALILMTPHRFYLDFNQEDIDSHINGCVGIVLDNTSIWKNYRFLNGTVYHLIGGGTLDING